MSRQQRILAALSPLCVEHLQELRDFGVPPTVQQALTLSMREVTGRPDATWLDARAVWVTGGFSGGLRRFIALLQDYARSPDEAAGREREELPFERHGRVLIDAGYRR